jgi:hypothetical protein
MICSNGTLYGKLRLTSGSTFSAAALRRGFPRNRRGRLVMSIAPLMRAAASTLALTLLFGGMALAADCPPAAKDALGNPLASSGTTTPGTPTTGAASERQMANNQNALGNNLGSNTGTTAPGTPTTGAAQERVGSGQNALGNNLGSNTGTTAPGTPTTGAASERQQMASNSRSAAQDRDCK